jgi:hypothetical protein
LNIRFISTTIPMFNIKFILTTIIIHLSLGALSQEFKGVGLIGLNLSQIDGDTMHGFDRAGLSLGAKLYFQTNQKYNIALEMLYSQRGSAPSLSKLNDPRSIKLNFIELPMVLTFNDWYIEKDKYYKVGVDVGLGYSYLFGINAPYYNEDHFRRHELGYLIGAYLRFNKKIGINVRYSSSFSNVYKNPIDDLSVLKSYFLTLRSEIYFN